MLVFAFIFLPSLCLLTFQTASLSNTYHVSSLNKTLKSFDPLILNNELNATISLDLENNLNYNNSDCLIICPPENETSIDITLKEYCNNLWKYDMGEPVAIFNFTLPKTHLIVQSILIGLFILSTIEAFVDIFMDNSPYRLLRQYKIQRVKELDEEEKKDNERTRQ